MYLAACEEEFFCSCIAGKCFVCILVIIPSLQWSVNTIYLATGQLVDISTVEHLPPPPNFFFNVRHCMTVRALSTPAYAVPGS